MGPPSDVSWFINPHNYSYLRTINHSYWSYLHQLNAILGAPHCINQRFTLSTGGPILYDHGQSPDFGGQAAWRVGRCPEAPAFSQAFHMDRT